MNRGVYIFLGIATLVCIFLFLSGVPEILVNRPPENLFHFYLGIGAFVALLTNIAIFCFFPRSRSVTLRVIGAIGVAGSLFTLVEAVRGQNFLQLIPALLFWLPGSIYLMLSGQMD